MAVFNQRTATFGHSDCLSEQYLRKALAKNLFPVSNMRVGEHCQPVERADHALHRARRHPGIERGRGQLGVAKQHLDDADIDAVLKQVRREAVPQCVRSNPLGDASSMGGLRSDTVHLPVADRLQVMLAREQPAIGMHHTLLAANLPPRARAALVDVVLANPVVNVLADTHVDEIVGTPSDGVTAVRITDTAGASRDLPCSVVFAFIGLDPATEMLPESVACDEAGAIIVDNTLRASAPGTWAIGAVRANFGGSLSNAGEDAAKVIAALS